MMILIKLDNLFIIMLPPIWLCHCDKRDKVPIILHIHVTYKDSVNICPKKDKFNTLCTFFTNKIVVIIIIVKQPSY